MPTAQASEPLAERRAQAVTGIRHDAAKTHTSRHHAVDLGQGNLGLRAGRSITRRHAGAFQAVSIARPALRQKQAQGHHHRHLTAGQRQRYQRLAIGVLSQRRGILRRDPDRMLPLLRQRGVVDHQHRIAAPDKPIRLNKEFLLQGRRIPDAGRNEVVQLIVLTQRKALRHRLNALAITGTDQPCKVKRAHPPPRLVPQAGQKRRQPAFKLFRPIQSRARHGRPPDSRPPMNHAKANLGIRKIIPSAKICQSSARP